jgi:predicted aspartyl protease
MPKYKSGILRRHCDALIHTAFWFAFFQSSGKRERPKISPSGHQTMPKACKRLHMPLFAKTAVLAAPALVLGLFYLSAPALAEPEATTTVAPVQVPFHLQTGHAYIDVMINGQGPFHFVFDTGAVNVMTPATAERLGLGLKGKVEATGTGGAQSAWKTKVETFSFGGQTKTDQVFYVLDLPSTIADGAQIDGLIGYEWLKQYPIKFDYDANTLTIYANTKPDFSTSGQAVPISFKGKTPQIDGNVDGFAGRFTIDTGSSGSLTLSTPFVEKNNLTAYYHAKTKVMSAIGVGGPVFSLMARAGKLDMGGVSVDKPVTYLAQQTKGTSADQSLAGNIGFGVLHRFNVTFDYPHSKIYFAPNTHFSEPDLADRSGLRLDAAGGTFSVVYVAENSPGSAAGLQAGDKIVAINGATSDTMTLADLTLLLKGETGTKVNFKLERDGKIVELELRDL